MKEYTERQKYSFKQYNERKWNFCLTVRTKASKIDLPSAAINNQRNYNRSSEDSVDDITTLKLRRFHPNEAALLKQISVH